MLERRPFWISEEQLWIRPSLLMDPFISNLSVDHGSLHWLVPTLLWMISSGVLKGDIRLRRRAASVGVYWMWELETAGVGLSMTTQPNTGLNSSRRGREAGSEKSQRRTVRCLRLQHRQRSSLQSDSEGFFLHSSSMAPLLMPQVL